MKLIFNRQQKRKFQLIRVNANMSQNSQYNCVYFTRAFLIIQIEKKETGAREKCYCRIFAVIHIYKKATKCHFFFLFLKLIIQSNEIGFDVLVRSVSFPLNKFDLFCLRCNFFFFLLLMSICKVCFCFVHSSSESVKIDILFVRVTAFFWKSQST